MPWRIKLSNWDFFSKSWQFVMIHVISYWSKFFRNFEKTTHFYFGWKSDILMNFYPFHFCFFQKSVISFLFRQTLQYWFDFLHFDLISSNLIQIFLENFWNSFWPFLLSLWPWNLPLWTWFIWCSSYNFSILFRFDLIFWIISWPFLLLLYAWQLPVWTIFDWNCGS